jgi:hypothetical protein
MEGGVKIVLWNKFLDIFKHLFTIKKGIQKNVNKGR